MDQSAQSKNLRTAVADTPEEILSLQHEVWMKNSAEKRLEMTSAFIDSCRQLNLDGIRNAHSDWNEAQIKQEYFRMVYGDFFSEDELKNIIETLVK